MKYLIKVFIVIGSFLILTSCSNTELEPKQAFQKMDNLINNASVVLDKVVDEKSAHLASKEIAEISNKYDDVVLRIKPIERISKNEASEIIEGFMRGRAAQDRFRISVKRIQSHGDAWLILESSTMSLLNSIKKGAVVMRSYIEPLPTSD